MTERKETPDILGQILGSPPPDQPLPIGVAVPAAPRSAPRRKSAAKKADGPKWEYLTISFQDQQGWRGRYADGEELDHWEKGPQLNELLDALGEAGWELIALTTKDHFYGRADAAQAFFKRVKA
jgi:phosphoglycolate phosphatase-like HAD superfamily hydrolase